MDLARPRVASPKGRPRRILVARLDNDGDVLLTGPAIRAIAASGAEVTLLSGPRGQAAAQLLPGVTRRETFLAPWIDPEPPPVDAGPLRDLAACARDHDEAIIFTSFHQSPLPLALVLRLADVPRIGAISVDYPGSLLDVRHHVPDDMHEVERNLSLVAAMGYRLGEGDDGLLRVRAATQPQGVPDGPYVVLHPGASVPARAWEPERWASLASKLDAAGVTAVVTGSQGERALTAYVARASQTAIDLGGRTTLAELAAVLGGASAVVVGNTGPAHLAAAARTPVVSLFAPTVPLERWAPYRVPYRALWADVPCVGCRARHCPVDGHPCLSKVTPGLVLMALGDLGVGAQSDVWAGPPVGTAWSTFSMEETT